MNLHDLLDWLDRAPAGTSVPACEVAALLRQVEEVDFARPRLTVQGGGASTWREKLWTVSPDVRIGVVELCEALDRSRDWCYRGVNEKRAASKGREPIPCCRLDGELVFRVGDVRAWLARNEEVVNPPAPPLRRAS